MDLSFIPTSQEEKLTICTQMIKQSRLASMLGDMTVIYMKMSINSDSYIKVYSSRDDLTFYSGGIVSLDDLADAFGHALFLNGANFSARIETKGGEVLWRFLISPFDRKDWNI
jgi:hypothetical protein